jgi:hypothetical protein
MKAVGQSSRKLDTPAEFSIHVNMNEQAAVRHFASPRLLARSRERSPFRVYLINGTESLRCLIYVNRVPQFDDS